jgi:hypothetical protein
VLYRPRVMVTQVETCFWRERARARTNAGSRPGRLSVVARTWQTSGVQSSRNALMGRAGWASNRSTSSPKSSSGDAR